MKKKSTSLLLALTLCISCLPACGGASNEPAHVPWHPPAASVAAAAAPGDETASEKDSGPAAADAPEADEPEADEPEADEPPAEPDPASIHGVARLGDLVGNYNAGLFSIHENKIFVDTEDDHNPYDLTWRYGPDSKRPKDFESPEWDALYRSSKDHYESMISEEYHYFGCSNPYWSDNPDNPFAEDGNTGYLCQFDMFTTKQPSIPYELD